MGVAAQQLDPGEGPTVESSSQHHARVGLCCPEVKDTAKGRDVLHNCMVLNKESMDAPQICIHIYVSYLSL